MPYAKPEGTTGTDLYLVPGTFGGTAAIARLVAGAGSGAALCAAVGVALRDAFRGRTSVT